MSNPSQVDQPTGTDRKFKISSAMRRHKSKNNKINKYIIANKNIDEVLINVAIKIAYDECNVMDKHNITKEK